MTKVNAISATLNGLDELKGGDAEVHVSISKSTGREQSTIKYAIEYRGGGRTVSDHGEISIFSDSVHDIRDLSLCLRKLADESDMTCEIADCRSTTAYSHRAQLCIYQDLLGISVLMFSKDTTKFAGIRFLDFFFPNDGLREEKTVVWCRLVAAPEDLAEFAERLREMVVLVAEIASRAAARQNPPSSQAPC